jgi:hypothetical protein
MQPLNEEALEAAKKSLIIRDVYFRDEHVVLAPAVIPHFTPEIAKSQFRMTTSILHDFEVEGEKDGAPSRYLEIEFKGYVRCLDKDPAEQGDAQELLSMEISLGLLYLVKEPCPEESIDEFVRMNAPFHAIPYWREHVHSVCSKRRFPPVTVPLYTRLRPQAAADLSAQVNQPPTE